ncbi:1-acylglycerol-3-phosphate O-acyltransferase Pnpla3-like isoform X2 [Neocloeon triangulifer]|uniref:1-acylglycerol-3-phosphate O-acyltransferase Pnpla3-like isoform X2 n=1 Tax=Neocloeon triangulifer TaxID=2078957 RepID=UPI00286F7D0B|nr:1-acylglycerol-3-phosphate O-acyltransferase Pnpla3-like isoform X2 [Neocloeon triangulifer]
MNLSFAGCGFLGIYHVGVAACLKKYAPHLLLNKISGASAGAIAGCCLLCDVPLGEITSDVLRVVSEARGKTLGPFSPSFNVQNILLEGLAKVLPDDCHERVSGKLHISLTRVYDGKNVIVSEFNSKEDLLQAIFASSFIPLFSGFLPPRLHGVRYMDGGLSNNLPTLDEHTITVSPFCGESDICPRDPSYQLLHVNLANTSIELSRQNIYRFARILFPPNPEILSDMCKQGFDDALRFLHRNNLINCTRCLAVQSTFTVSEALDESCFDYDPQCRECKIQRQESMVADLPETVMTIFQEAIDTANKGLVNWIFKHRGMKLLSVLSLPCVLPADIVYATFTNPFANSNHGWIMSFCAANNLGDRFTKVSCWGDPEVFGRGHCHKHKRRRFLSSAPHIGSNLRQLSQYLMENLATLISSVNNKREQLTAKISCNLAITEYRGTKYDIESSADVPAPVQNQMNFNFTLNLEEQELPVDQPSALKFQNKMLGQASRRSSSISIINNQCETNAIAEDTFDHILQVTAHNDALMAFYYLDENNKVKVTEIFDVTDADTAGLLDPDERNTNLNLEYDDRDWLNSTSWDEQCEDDRLSIAGSEDSLLNSILEDNTNIFSDPESEWQQNSPSGQGEKCPDSRPESDQLSVASP